MHAKACTEDRNDRLACGDWSDIYIGGMLFLLSNQQCQGCEITEYSSQYTGTARHQSVMLKLRQQHVTFYEYGLLLQLVHFDVLIVHQVIQWSHLIGIIIRS